MEEATEALKDMHPHKASSPDRFNSGFFQKKIADYWIKTYSDGATFHGGRRST